MNTGPLSTSVTKANVHPIGKINELLDQRVAELRRALPSHIPVERFKRVVLTACQLNTELVTVDRQSLWIACMRAAQDGLMPDGRDGVILPYKDNNSRSRAYGHVIAQWQPMVSGFLKRFRNSGQFKSIATNIVREGERFEYWIDEHGEHMRHEPGDSTAKPIKAYAVAVTKEGGSMIRVMSVTEINKRRAVSRAKDGPMWKEWWDEAAMKTVLKNLAKRLPSSSDLDEMIHRDDEDALPPLNAPAMVETGQDREQSSQIDEGSDTQTGGGPPPDDGISEQPEPQQSERPRDEHVERAFAAGVAAQKAGHTRQAVPGEYRTVEAEHLAQAWRNGWDATKASAEQRS
jgi:recombination protein RecT